MLPLFDNANLTMYLSKKNRRPITAQQGFSLLELLVVISILVALAGIGISLYDGIDQTERENLTEVEIAELAQAIRQFNADTGFWPGLIDLDGDGDFDEHSIAFDWSILTDVQYYNWDTIAQRGWRGPYLSEPLNTSTITNGLAIALSGLNSGATGDFGPSNTTLLDPFSNAYLLLTLNNRSVIVSAGINGSYDEFGGLGLSAVAADEADFYNNLCSGNFTTDDIVACP